MNILFFSRLFKPHIGGVEKHVFEVSKLLIEKGHKVIVVTEQDSPKEKLNERIDGIILYRIPGLKDGYFKKFKIWKWLFNNINLIRQSDVVHCHDVFFWYLPFRFLFPFKKIFTTFHGYENYPLKQKEILVHKISEILSMGNICIGDFIRKWYETKPNFVSYGGVNIPKVKSQPARNASQRDAGGKSEIKNQISAAFIGRLDEQTGFKKYLDAVRQIRKKIPNFTLTVFGDGKFKANSEDGIKYKGFVSNPLAEIEKYNFALVSRYLSILEAMAAKKMVLAIYDNPLKEDYLRMAPFSKFITISNSPSELVSKLFYYLDNAKVKEEMIAEAYSWVKKHTWEEVTNTYLKLWKI